MNKLYKYSVLSLISLLLIQGSAVFALGGGGGGRGGGGFGGGGGLGGGGGIGGGDFAQDHPAATGAALYNRGYNQGVDNSAYYGGYGGYGYGYGDPYNGYWSVPNYNAFPDQSSPMIQNFYNNPPPLTGPGGATGNQNIQSAPSTASTVAPTVAPANTNTGGGEAILIEAVQQYREKQVQKQQDNNSW